MAGSLTAALAVLACPAPGHAGATIQTFSGTKTGANAQWGGTITASRTPSGAFSTVRGHWTDGSNGSPPSTWPNTNTVGGGWVTTANPSVYNWQTQGAVNTQFNPINVAGSVWTVQGNGVWGWSFSNIHVLQ